MIAHLTPAPCCGTAPTLRVKPIVQAGLEIPYVLYVCSVCGNESGLGITENEARSYWSPRMVETPTL